MFTDVKKLKIFVAIVEEGSFTGAAERLNMAQPWVSVQLKQLEDLLDLNLVERSKGKLVKPSASGRELYPIAKKLLASCAAASEEIGGLRHRNRGKLVLGVDPITLYIPERNHLIAQFMAQAKDTDLQIVSRFPTDLFEGLRNGDFDMILTSLPCPDADVEVMPLYEYPLHLLVPKEHVAEYDAHGAEGLAGSEILTLPDSYHPGMFSWLRTVLGPAGVKWHECPETSFEALIRYAAMMGIATLSPDFSDAMPEMRSLMEIRPLRGTPLPVRWGLMRRGGYRKKAPESFWRMAAASQMAQAA